MMNNIEELREHCEEMIAISRMQYAYIPASSIITLIDRVEKAEKESKQWYSVVEAAISDDAEWRKQSNTASEAIGYLTTGIVMLKERAEKAEAALSAVQLDATRWRALLSSPAIRILGHAGLQDDKPIDGHYCHFGMEIWSHHEPYYDNKKAGELITRYADNMIASSLVEGNADAE